MMALVGKVLVLSDRREHLHMLQALLCGCSSPPPPSHPGAGAKEKKVPSADVGFYVGGSKGRELEAAARCGIILATFGMASEGLDVAALNSLVLATPRADIQQSVGRILRYVCMCVGGGADIEQSVGRILRYACRESKSRTKGAYVTQKRPTTHIRTRCPQRRS
jgi:hypothetical protein